jgi:hypothetical protein
MSTPHDPTVLAAFVGRSGDVRDGQLEQVCNGQPGCERTSMQPGV